MIPVYLSLLGILQSIIGGTIGPLLSLVLENVIGVILTILGNIIQNLLYTLWLHLLRLMLKTIYFAVRIFDIFSGMAPVSVLKNGVRVQNSMLGFFLESSQISKFLAAMTMGAAALAFLFAMYQTAKSISDAAASPEFKPLSRVLGDGIKSALTFMLVPFLCILCLQLTSALMTDMKVAFDAASPGGKMEEFDDILFKMTAESGLKVSKDSQEYKDFWAHEKPFQNADLLKEEEVYDLKKLDYFTGLPATLILLIILVCACLAFIRRIIEILLLYIVSPYFSATIALDGGAKFRKWRNTFIGTFFGCFGSIFAMRLYLLLIPMISADTLRFSDNPKVNFMAKLAFVIGSAWSIFKGQELIEQLINPGSKSSGESTALLAGLAMKAGGKAGAAVKKLFG